LRAALREDPDYILVGEMRDLRRPAALTAAERVTWCSVPSTSSAAKTIDRHRRVSLRGHGAGVLSSPGRRHIPDPAEDGSAGIAAHEIMIGTPAIRT
jgi:twitching motility protein PilT